MKGFLKVLRRRYHRMDARFLSGHIKIGPITIYGRNAMHWGVEVHLRRGGWLSFRLPLFCFGRWWPLYLYYSPDSLSSTAYWGFGKDFKKRRYID